jgi:hypothetical protein
LAAIDLDLTSRFPVSRSQVCLGVKVHPDFLFHLFAVKGKMEDPEAPVAAIPSP